MVKVRQALLCDYGSLSIDGKASAAGLFSAVNAHAFPVVHPTIYLVFEMEAEEADIGAEVRVAIEGRDAKGDRLFTVEGGGQVPPDVMPDGRTTYWQVVRLPPLPLGSPGRYPVVVTINESSSAEISFYARLVDPPR